MDKYTGKKLDGRYEIGELIGVGGMAYVYHCYDTIDEREVSIKILKDEFLNNADFIRRFKNESKAIAVLSHPNIVKIYDVSFGDMIQYIVMEYIDGITLKEYIAQQGVIDWRETVHYATQVLKALQHAHAHGIVHRDIKPQNIMLLSDGSIKVMDFGIARFADNATRTMTDQAIGSVHYIAPEQARGGITDGKSDIYSVGVMLYEMLTGRLPFEADNAVSVAIMQLQSTAKQPSQINPDIPGGLEDIIIKAMQKNPAARYQSAGEMLYDFEQFRANPDIRFPYGCFVDDEPTKYVSNIGEGTKRTDAVYRDYNDNYSSNRAPRRRSGLDDKMFVDDKPKKRKKSTVAIAGVICALVVIGIIIGVFALVKVLNNQETEDVDVPDFIGMTVEEAQQNNPYNFVFETETKYDETQELGVIIDQDPKANSKKVKEGATITLTVNSIDNEVPVPGLSGSTREEAVDLLEQLGLVPEVLEVENENIEAGTVVKTDPTENTTVAAGSTVYVYVSMGSAQSEIKVPDVREYTYEEAVSMLRAEGLLAKVSYSSDSTLPKDTVVSQNPLPNSLVQKGYVVELVLSSGQPAEKEVSIYVDLPAEEGSTVSLRVLVDGAVDSDNSKDVVPKYNSSYTVKLKGTGTAHVVVELNGTAYREYDVDFSTQNVSTTASYPYTVQQDPTDEATNPPSPEEEE